ncbi:MAG: amino acid transporter [Parachlamydiales bacterium]|nr:amino acid transporter [Parachlamydiales bacterium]
MSTHRGSLIGALLLVCGTSIGGGMLALPVITAPAGFFPSFVTMLLVWGFMTSTALLLLEANMWMKDDAHILTLASHLLGKWGKWIACLIYLFIAYASLIAYVSSGGDFVQEAATKFGFAGISKWISCIIFIVVFGVLIDRGAKLVGRVNAILVLAMVIAYFGLVSVGFKDVSLALLMHQDWPKFFLAAPLLLTVFSFQCIVPSLTIYLQRDVKKMRFAIVGGTTMTLCIYIIWQILVLGSVPYDGAFGLNVALKEGVPATDFYRQAVQNPIVSSFAAFFSFFAIATSFLGIGLGLFDFLADGLKVSKTGKNKYMLGAIIMVPSLIFAAIYPRIFLVALDASGGLGDSILNGIIPVLMVWVGRYKKGYIGEYRYFGGRKALTAILCFALLVLCIEIAQFCGYFPLG